MNKQNYLQSFTEHDEALLVTMMHMIDTNPNVKIIEASYNIIKIEGNNLEKFLNALVKTTPILDMKAYKVHKKQPKQKKYKTNTDEYDLYCVYFTFYNLRR